MKRCPNCNRTYTDTSLNFCLEDGTPLVVDAPPPVDLNATISYPPTRETDAPPPTEIYRPQTPIVNRETAPARPRPQQWAPTPGPVQKKSNAIWWILGGLAAIAIIGIGLVVMIIAIASISSSPGNRNSLNTNAHIENRNSNVTANANLPETNTNTNSSPASITDDFSQHTWGSGDSKFGKIWYDDDEYHMSSKEKTFVVMYAPSDAYDTENATVKVTARSVDGTVPSAGFGLMVHCAQSKAKQLEDYALLIYPSEEPEYEVIMHKDGNQTSLVSRTKSNTIRSGTTPNQLEIRIQGAELSFYINGQYLTRITDTENYRRGRAGLYTSDTTDVAFDDLEITRAPAP
jgi:hypothetical protein